jgi:hypothetical protein
MRTTAEANQTNRAIAAQLLAAKLTEPMRRALLSAQPTELNQPEWDYVADYCPGHESLRGDSMGASVHCPVDSPCPEAQAAYNADRAPDPDFLHIDVTDTVKVATVVALMQRGLCLDGRTGNDHKLTDLGYDVHAYLQAMRADGRL